MSLSLGNYWEQLTCEICGNDIDIYDFDGDGPGGLPDGFWDDEPDPSEPSNIFDFDIPSIYPNIDFGDDGNTVGVGGSF